MRIVNNKVRERRKKRMFIPAFYFLLEIVFVWLVLSLIQKSFFLHVWAWWSLLIFIVFVIYFLLKTIHVYDRQKDYPIE